VSALLVGTLLILSPVQSRAQDSAGKRKLMDHAAPAYPVLARSMALAGVVKAEVLVAPDGTAKAVDIRGGHPVLAQAAATAIRRWKWETAAHESHELVQVSFSPPE